LVVYDSFLTLDTEVAVFWCHRLKLSSILYFVNRYVEIMSRISAAVLIFPVRDQVSTLPFLPKSRAFRRSLQLFSAFRAYALTDHNLWLATLVFILNATFLVPDIVSSNGFLRGMTDFEAITV
ncbi:hypothetical protein K466DRAFT_495941, partial [Polyporus arcularius HHB13444]